MKREDEISKFIEIVERNIKNARNNPMLDMRVVSENIRLVFYEWLDKNRDDENNSNIEQQMWNMESNLFHLFNSELVGTAPYIIGIDDAPNYTEEKVSKYRIEKVSINASHQMNGLDWYIPSLDRIADLGHFEEKDLKIFTKKYQKDFEYIQNIEKPKHSKDTIIAINLLEYDESKMCYMRTFRFLILERIEYDDLAPF